MAKKNARKPSGAAGIATVEDDLDHGTDGVGHEPDKSQPNSDTSAAKPQRKGRAKADQQSSEQFGVGDIRKAATFVNSIGGLEKAIAVLQILKVAKEVQ